ncbi:MAG: leucine-rich repeat domain-containing protein [Candidatus Scatovivens sp.]
MKKKKLLYFVLVLLIIFSINIKVFAEGKNNINIEETEYSKRYLEWLALPEEERKGTIAPLPFNVRETAKTGLFNFVRRAAKSITLPESYVLIDKNETNIDVKQYGGISIERKDQMNTGECWAFSSLSTVETNLALNQNEYYEFSERHMEYNTSKSFLEGQENPWALNREAGYGGFATTAFTYLSRGTGPLLEEDMPFENNEANIDINTMPKIDSTKKIGNLIYLPSIYKEITADGIIYMDANYNEYSKSEVTEIRNKIKEHIMKNGGIVTAIWAPSEQYFYNPDKYSENNNGIGMTNHDVTIIGWDDNFSKDNFKYKPNEDGAYIVLNSWGKEWGNEDIYYISYEDLMVESSLRGLANVEDVDYDTIYQYDISEMISNLRCNYAANIFTSKDYEELTEISIGTIVDNTYNVYLSQNTDNLSLQNAQKIFSNVELKAGYNRLKLNEKINLEKGSNFAIIVEALNSDKGIGFENSGEYFGNATSNFGESFASMDGINWDDMHEYNIDNFSIKAYTKTNNINLKIIESKCSTLKLIETLEGTIFFNLDKSTAVVDENIGFEIYDENGAEVSQKFEIDMSKIKDNKIYVSMTSDVTQGEYFVKLLYNSEIVDEQSFSVEGKDYDQENFVKIYFPDKNLYNAMKTIAVKKDEIYMYFDETQEIILDINIKRINLSGTEKEINFDEEVAPGCNVSDLTGIQYLKQLETLILTSNPIEDLKPIETLNNLKELEIYYPEWTSYRNSIKNISVIENLVNLQKVVLTNNDELSDINFLSNLTNLKYLDLHLNSITDVEVIKQLSNLEYLNLNGNKISNIEELSGLINLKYLDITNTQTQDISFVKQFSQLKELRAASNNISELDLLKNLTQLEKVSLRSNNIKDISSFENLVNIKELYLGRNDIDNISSLENLVELYFLELSDNNITDITVIQNLNKIKDLELANNKIEDVTAIKNLSNLEILVIVNNKISNIDEILNNLDNLKYLYAYGNNIEGIQVNKITKIEELELAANKIKDLSWLKIENFPKLKYLNLYDNNIEDASNIENGIYYQLEYLDISNNLIQKDIEISENNEIIEIDLLPIMKQALNENSLLYSKNGLEFKNCEIDYENNKLIIDPQEIDYAWLKIKSGLAENTSFEIYLTYNSEVVTKTVEVYIPDKNLFDAIVRLRNNIEYSRLIKDYNNSTQIITLHKKLLEDIKILDFKYCNIMDLTGIEVFENLEEINLKGNYELNKINNLSSLKNLKTIDISGTYNDELNQEVKTLMNEFKNTGLKIINNRTNGYWGVQNYGGDYDIPIYFENILENEQSSVEAYMLFDVINKSENYFDFEIDYSGDKEPVELLLDKENNRIKYYPNLDITISHKNEYRAMYVIVKGGPYDGTSYIQIYRLQGQEIKNFEITKMPDKLEYIEGENFNPEGTVAKITYLNDRTIEVDDYEIENGTELTLNQTEVKLKYKINQAELEQNIPITVKQKTLQNLVINTNPNKTTYIEGQNFDISGLELMGEYDNGKSYLLDINNCTVYRGENLQLGQTEVTVEYTENDVTKQIKIPIEVIEKSLNKIEIGSNPEKINYIEGQNFDSTGLKVMAKYNDGTEKEVTDYVVKNGENLQLGQTEVIVEYTEKEITKQVKISIIVVEKTLVSIEIRIAPEKVNYIEGQDFDSAGLKVIAKFDNESEDEIKDYIIKNGENLQLGQTEVIVEYTKNEVTKQEKIEITVVEKTLISIEIESTPEKVSYIEGQSFDSTGLKIIAKYDNGRKEEITNYIIKNGENLQLGQTEVIIEYTEREVTKQTKIEISVVEKTLASIEIVSAPEKVRYIEGQEFDSTGLKVIAKYDNGAEKEITNYIIKNGENLQLEQDEVTLEYTEKEITKQAKISITVLEKSLSSIDILEDAKKVSYIEDQSFDSTGLRIIAKYDNETEKEITNYTIKDGDNLQLGQTEVIVEYTEKGITKQVKIAITVVKKTLVSIEIISAPEKVNYIEGQNFDSTGLKVMAKYDNGIEEEITNYTIEDGKNLQLGQTEVTVEYTEKEVTKQIKIPIKVIEKVIDNIEFIEYVEEQEGNTNYLNGILSETTIEKMLLNINTNSNIEFFDNKDQKVSNSSDIVKTGMKLKVSLNGQIKEYVLIVKGDCNGNGKCNVSDLTTMMLSISESLGTEAKDESKILKQAYAKAADINGDGRINVVDITRMSMLIAEKK